MAEWWQDLFDEKYLTLFAEARGPLHTAQEVEALTTLLAEHGAPAGGQVLDLACGYGRTAVPLAQAGYRLAGFDLSPYLLARAEQAAVDAGVAIEFQRGDMRQLPMEWAGRFDAVINVFTAFGYFEAPEDNQQVLAGIAQVLKPGGLFIIDVSHRDRIMAAYRETDWFEVDDLLVCTSRQFDPISGMNTEMMLWTDDKGQRHSVFFKVHVHTATELTRMLRQAELEPLA
ncbi:MAG TPA: class I SAM-dependent methyltransferase, partial [Anaerolineae bacterium]|nr:class I SAM-dependent methyltransferase [Anaerolineae bacterium]